MVLKMSNFCLAANFYLTLSFKQITLFESLFESTHSHSRLVTSVRAASCHTLTFGVPFPWHFPMHRFLRCFKWEIFGVNMLTWNASAILSLWLNAILCHNFAFIGVWVFLKVNSQNCFTYITNMLMIIQVLALDWTICQYKTPDIAGRCNYSLNLFKKVFKRTAICFLFFAIHAIVISVTNSNTVIKYLYVTKTCEPFNGMHNEYGQKRWRTL